jgi:hypothetical protein
LRPRDGKVIRDVSFVNLMILIDDANRDETVAMAKAMNQV